jgi:hypothetical protein
MPSASALGADGVRRDRAEMSEPAYGPIPARDSEVKVVII